MNLQAFKTLGVIYFHDTVDYSPSPDGILLMTQTANMFVKNEYMPAHVSATTSDSLTKSFLMNLTFIIGSEA